MRSNSKDIVPVDSIEGDFLAAFDRLKLGKPRDPKLAAQAKIGALRMTVTSLAREAGHSRTLIGHQQCKYPRVRDKLIALRCDPEMPTRLTDIVDKKREEAATLRRQLALAHTENAALVIRLVLVEKKLRISERRCQRLKAQRSTGQGAGQVIHL